MITPIADVLILCTYGTGDRGAGDAFSAAVAVALAEGRSFTASGRLGCAAAALATTKLGAQAGLPRRFELQSYLDELAGHHESYHT